LQEVVILLSKLITQIALILTSKAAHVFNAFGIEQWVAVTRPLPSPSTDHLLSGTVII
jgi:hypothetical protein